MAVIKAGMLVLLAATVTKVKKRGDIEYAHVEGTHGLAMWVPTSELQVQAPAVSEPEIKYSLEEAMEIELRDLNAAKLAAVCVALEIKPGETNKLTAEAIEAERTRRAETKE